VWWVEIEAWLRWLRSAGSPPASIRNRTWQLRHAAERDLLAVQRLLGHSKPETTARYADLPDGALERAVRSVTAGGAA